MKNHPVLIALILVRFSTVGNLAIAEAQWDTTQATVKIKSGLCHSNDFDYRGSGVLLRHEQRLFVLTSEHVLLHGNEDVCHSVSNDLLGTKQALLIAADWSEGLALLEIKGFNTDSALPELKDINSTAATANSTMQLVGYPYDFDHPVISGQSLVLTAASHRHFLPKIGNVVELVQGHGEFGMSGGPAFDIQSKTITGLLSHQFLQLEAGQRPMVGEYASDGQAAANHLLLIAATDLKAWLQKVLAALDANQQPSMHFVKDARDQISGTETVYTAGLSFTAESYENSELSTCPTESDHGGGIGGDPMGVGGTARQHHRPIKLIVARDRDSTMRAPTSWYLPSKAKWLQQLEELLLRPYALNIPALVQRSGDGQLRKVCVYSLEEFFRKLTSEQADALTLVEGRDDDPQHEDRLVQRRTFGQNLEATVQQLTNPNSRAWSRLNRIFFERLLAAGQLTQDDNWVLLKSADFEVLADLSGPYKLAWQEIFREHFNEGTQILADLHKLADTYRYLRL